MITCGQTDVEERISLSLCLSGVRACNMLPLPPSEFVRQGERREGGRNDGKERRMESLMAILLVE